MGAGNEQREISPNGTDQDNMNQGEPWYKTLFLNNGSVMMLIDPVTGKIMDANPSACRFYGWPHSELCSKTIFEINILSPEEIRNEMQKTRKERHKHFFFKHRLANGDIRDVEIFSSHVPLGNLKLLFSIIHDITDRKQKEELIRQIHDNYDSFFNTIDEFLFVLDEQANIVYTNSTVNERLGYSVEELQGKSVLDIYPMERREEVVKIAGEMLTGKTDFWPVPIITKSGEQIPVETRIKLGVWDGKPAIFGVSKDISRLRLSEEKFSKVFQINPSACGLSDLVTGKYVELNKAFCTLLGYEKDEVLGKSAGELDILSNEDKKNILSKIESDGKLINAEAVLKAKNGELKHVLLSAEDIFIQEKKYRYTVVHDITYRKKAEEALKESETKFRALYEAASDGIFILKDDIFFDCNPASEILFNGRKQDIVGLTVFELSPPVQSDGRSSFLKAREKIDAALSGIPQFFEWKHLRCDGSTFDTEVSLSKIDLNGIHLLLAIVRDITERKRSQEALQVSEEKYRGLFDESITTVYVFDEKKNFINSNQAGLDLLGYSREELMTMSIPDVDADPVIVLPAHEELLSGGQLINYEHKLRRKNGNIVTVLNNSIPLTDAQGNIVGMLSTLIDITARKLAEDEIRKLNETLEERVAERTNQLQTINKELAFHLQEIEQFSYITSHDLQEPLRTLTNFTSLIKKDYAGKLDENGEIYIEFIHNSASRMKELVKGLLEYSLLGKVSVKTTVDCNKIVGEVLSDLADSIKEEKATITVANLPVINGYTTEIRVLFQNLVNNAIKFRKKKITPEIKIFAESKGKEWIFAIKDNGIGIQKKDKEKIFIIFKQLHNRDEYEGTGIGLSHCKKIVELHGGKIWVESTPGKGSTFLFTIQQQ